MKKIDVSGANGENYVSTILTSLKGVLISYIFSLLMLALCAVFLTVSAAGDFAIQTTAVIVTILSTMVAGFITAKKIKKRGWIQGAMAGMIYVIILYILGALILNKFSITFYTTLIFFFGFLFGAIGGIIGVNTKKRK